MTFPLVQLYFKLFTYCRVNKFIYLSEGGNKITVGIIQLYRNSTSSALASIVLVIIINTSNWVA